MTSGYFSFERTRHAIPALDGLRALAILMVLARHAIDPLFSSESALLPLLGWDAAIPMVNGWMGVDLFFALSGFLIGCHLIRNSRRIGDLKLGRYFAARVLRIVPSYYAVLFIAAAGLFPYYSVSPESLEIRLVYHLLFLQDYLPANIVVSFWSLGVEEKFYLLAPLIIYVSFRSGSIRARYLFLSLLLLIPLVLRCLTAVTQPQVIEYNAFFFVYRSPFHVSFDGMVAGLIAAYLYDDITSGRIRLAHSVLVWANGIALTSIGLHLCVLPLMGSISAYDKSLQGLVIGLSFATVVLFLALSNRPHAVLSSRVGMVLARISYPLYLVHLPLVGGFVMLYQNHWQSLPGGLLWYALFFTLVSIVAALLIHFLIEKPFLLLKDKTHFASVNLNGECNSTSRA